MGNGERPRLSSGSGERGRVLEAAEEVRLREDHGRCALGGAGDPIGVDDAAVVADLDHLEPEPGRVGLDDLAHLRVEGLGQHDARSTGGVLRDVARVGRDREPVVSGRVRHVHPRQLADRRLVLEDRLQDSLAHLRLVRRVRGQELAPLQDRVDDRRHVVVVDPCTEERELDAGVGVLRRQLSRCRTSSASVSAGGTSRSPLKRTASGICAKRSSIEETPIVASISSRSCVGEREVPGGHCSATITR